MRQSKDPRWLPALLGAALCGCAATGPPVPQDPWESFNRSMYEFNDTLDKAVLAPTARAYQSYLPGVVRTGIGNFFNNLDDVVVTFNDLLQFKLRGAAVDVARVLINTTIGIYGLIDVAGYLGIQKRNEDFGQTLGYWGVGPGPYLVLPFFGPRTLRDAGGGVADSYVDPLYAAPDATTFYSAYALEVVDNRAGLLSAGSVAETAALDPYTFLREAYLQRRLNLVYDGNPPVKPAEDELDLLNLDQPAPPQ